MALSAAALHASGGILVIVTSALPGRAGSAAIPIAGAVALAAAAVLFVGRTQLPLPAFHAGALLGTTLIGVVLYADRGPRFVGYGSLYTFVAVYVCYWFVPRTAMIHLALVIASCGVALLQRDGGIVGLPDFLMYSGAAVVAGAVVGWLGGQLRRAARVDPLTGVANRRAWEDDLAREASRSERGGRPLCVIVADLDGFKLVNDHRGHAAGDALLRLVADSWSEVIRPADSLARWGGDEFALVLPDCDPECALDVAERLRGALPPGQTFSAGVARFEPDEELDRLVQRADAALYTAKRGGRDCAILAPRATPPTTGSPGARSGGRQTHRQRR